MKDENRAGATLTVVYAAVGISFLVASLWRTVSTSLCSGQIVSDAHEQGVWCFEFWLNRYQIAFTGFGAILAAYIAWRVGARQITEARRQAAAALSLVYRSDRQQLAEILNLVVDLFNSIKKVEGNAISRAMRNIETLHNDIDDSEALIDKLRRSVAIIIRSDAKQSAILYVNSCNNYLSMKRGNAPLSQKIAEATIPINLPIISLEANYRATTDRIRDEIAKIDGAIAALDEQLYQSN
jgi:hypothetical protein